MSASFAFKHHELLHGNLHDATATIPGHEHALLAVAAKGPKVMLSRHAGGLYVSLDLTPEQTRVVAAELLAAADALAAPATPKREA